MRALNDSGKWLVIVVLVVGLFIFAAKTVPFGHAQTQATTPSPSEAPSRAGATQTGDSDVFTTDHHSAIAAMRDFLGLRSQPVQPIAFPHKTHLANNLKCLDCHAGADVGPDAAIPSVKFCMTCHLVIATDKPEVKKVAAFQARHEDIPWVRVYNYSQYAHVRFNHAPHIRANVPCATCHGDLTKQTTAQRVVNLDMGYCLTCHEQRQAPIDCQTCHF
jgi:hypothetical protein